MNVCFPTINYTESESMSDHHISIVKFLAKNTFSKQESKRDIGSGVSMLHIKVEKDHLPTCLRGNYCFQVVILLPGPKQERGIFLIHVCY